MTLTIGMIIFSVVIGSAFTGSLVAISYIPIWIEQMEYADISDPDHKINYVLNEMSCKTVIASTEIQLSTVPEPKIIDGECWDHCEVLMPNYEPEPDHYFIHVPFGEDGYMYFDGLDELVQECKRH